MIAGSEMRFKFSREDCSARFRKSINDTPGFWGAGGSGLDDPSEDGVSGRCLSKLE